MQNCCVLSIVYFLILFCTVNAQNVHHLQPGSKVDYYPNQDSSRLAIYCYGGRPKYIINLWQTVFLKINSKSVNFDLYESKTPKGVISEYENHRSSWSYNLFSMKTDSIKLEPFSSSCVGVDSSSFYSVELILLRVDYWKVLLLLFGIILFLTASRLCQNALFYYICGISFGITASFLILVYLISKLFPRKPLMYGFIVGGWTIGVYLLQLLWDNFRTILEAYQVYVAYYFLTTGLISFFICYRLGPPTNPRSRNLIKWSLMSAGLTLIFNSSYFKEAVMGIIVLLVIAYNFPKVWIAKSRTYWKRRFPPKTQLLSNEEYYQEGVKETCKALDELREYCSSPKCNQWKTVLKLRDAKRFASFIEGNSHLSDEEIIEYENDQVLNNYEDDNIEDLTDDSESSIEL